MAQNPYSYPQSAFVLGLVGAALQALAALTIPVTLAFAAFPWPSMVSEMVLMMGSPVMPRGWGFLVLPWAAGAAAIVLLSFVGVLSLRSPTESRIQTGGVLLLVAAVLAAPTMWGFLIGSLLMFLASLLALVWRPSDAL